MFHIKQKRKRFDQKLAFYIALLTLPILQFIIFYIYVNINSVILAFQDFEITGKGTFVGFDNFKVVWQELTSSNFLKVAMKNTIMVLFIVIFFGMTLPLLFSYYIYKKKPMGKFFRVILFMPSIISSLVLVLAYKYFVEVGIPEIWGMLFDKEIRGLLSNINTEFPTVLVFNFCFGMGASFLLYASAMSGISDSIVDSAKVDGFTLFQEFIYITFPMIYPTYVTFIVVNVGTIFSNQIGLYSFYELYAPEKMYTMGYFLYTKTVRADFTDYPYLSAFGLVLTAIIVPITLALKHLLEKFGPTME